VPQKYNPFPFPMIFIIVISVLSLDQLTKFLILTNLKLHDSVPLVKGVLHLTLVNNRGAAFGILRNQVPLFILTSVFAIIMILLSLKEKKQKGVSLAGVSLGLILAGALGNLIDRLCLGYVVDFLDLRIWPVFNLADSAITVGAVLLGYAILMTNDKIQSTSYKSQ